MERGRAGDVMAVPSEKGLRFPTLASTRRLGRMMYDILEHMQRQIKPPNLSSGCGISLALGNNRGLRWGKIHCVDWNSIAQNTTRGLISVHGPCCYPRERWLEIRVGVCSLWCCLTPALCAQTWLPQGTKLKWVHVWDHVKALWSMPPVRATSGSVVLIQPRAVLISMVCVTTKAHADSCGPCPQCWSRTMLWTPKPTGRSPENWPHTSPAYETGGNV